MLALLVAASALTVHAQDDLLQALSVQFTFYTQGPPVANHAGGTNYIAEKQSFGTKDLIRTVSASGTFSAGDTLSRLTPTPIYVTNLVPVSTTNLILTNISTSTEIVSNALLFGSDSNFIGDTNVTFGTNIVLVGGVSVTIGTNFATVGTNLPPLAIGTNTSVTTSNLTNAAGYIVGTNYTFVMNEVNIVTNNKTGPGAWVVYNTHTKTTTPISTNVYFDIHTAAVYSSPTNLAYVHGENIRHNGEIQFGTTDEIRTLILSNSTMRIKLNGYAKGRLVPVSLGGGAVVYSQDYHWTGGGSGIISNTTPSVITGEITEFFYKLLK